MTISVAHTIDKDMEHSSQTNTSQTSTVPADGCFKKNLITSDDNICSITKDKDMEQSSKTQMSDVISMLLGALDMDLAAAVAAGHPASPDTVRSLCRIVRSKNLITPDDNICSITKDKDMEHSSQPTQYDAWALRRHARRGVAFVEAGYERTYRTMLGPEPGMERRLMKIHDFSLHGVPTGTAIQLFPPDLYIRYPETESQTTEEMMRTLPEMMDKPMARCSRLNHSYWEDWFPAGAYQMIMICIGGEHATHFAGGCPAGGKIPSKWEDRRELLLAVADLIVTPIDVIADAFAPYWAIHSEFFSNIEVMESGVIANNIYMTTPAAIYFVHFVWDTSSKLYEYKSHGSFCPADPKQHSKTEATVLRAQQARQHQIRKAQRKKAVELEKALRKKKRQIRQTEQHMKRLRELPVKLLDEMLSMSIHEQVADPDHEPNIRLVITEYEPKPTAAELYEQMVRDDMYKVQKQRIKRSGRKH